MRKLPSILSLTIMGLVASAWPSAQAQPAGPAAPPASSIDMATAKKIAAGAIAAASGARISTAVVDANGDLVYFERMDGAQPRSVNFALAKARAVVMFGVSTKQLQDAARERKPVTVTLTAPMLVPALELGLAQGGLPVVKDGKLIAAVGVGGAKTAQMDEDLAQAGVNAVSATK